MNATFKQTKQCFLLAFAINLQDCWFVYNLNQNGEYLQSMRTPIEWGEFDDQSTATLHK